MRLDVRVTRLDRRKGQPRYILVDGERAATIEDDPPGGGHPGFLVRPLRDGDGRPVPAARFLGLSGPRWFGYADAAPPYHAAQALVDEATGDPVGAARAVEEGHGNAAGWGRARRLAHERVERAELSHYRAVYWMGRPDGGPPAGAEDWAPIYGLPTDGCPRPRTRRKRRRKTAP